MRHIPQCRCRASAGLCIPGILFFIQILRYAKRRHVGGRSGVEGWRDNLVS